MDLVAYTNWDQPMTPLKTYTDWRKSWDIIVPGKFGPSGYTGLLLYDRSAGTASFYDTDGKGGMTPLKTYTDWRKSWDIIVPYAE
jgi:hypothetical protein